jgi:hypothetical protein
LLMGMTLGSRWFEMAPQGTTPNMKRELSELTRQKYTASEQAARKEKLGIWQTDLPKQWALTEREAENSQNTRPSGRTSSVPAVPKEPSKYVSSMELAVTANNSSVAQSEVRMRTSRELVIEYGSPDELRLVFTWSVSGSDLALSTDAM